MFKLGYLLVFAAILGQMAPSAAEVTTEQAGGTCLGAGGASLTCDGDKTIQYLSQSPSRPGASSGIVTSGTSKKYFAYDKLTTGPDGKDCVTTGYVEEGTVPTDAVPDDTNDHIPTAGGFSNIFADYPPCPLQPVAPGQPVPTETRAMFAARYWEQVLLPKPAPVIAPGRAITGKNAYLETRGEVRHTYTNSGTLFGPLQITAVGTYTVDWGDGTTTGPHSFEGIAWPDGKITHQYTKVGTYNVVVTEKWTANWNLGGESGVLRTLQSSGRIDNFPVEQIQAVIGR